MISTSPHANPPTVLMVDDEAVSRTVLEYYLKKNGYRALVADSAAAARRHVADLGPAAIDCVVTDYKMPGESGLELLLWLKQNDPALAVVMITATTEREFVTATLRGGADDFLDKPISEPKLAAAVTAGIATTAQRRRLVEADRSIREVGQTQHQMFGLGPEAARCLDICYHPCHAAGGDFVNYFSLGPGRFLVLAGDVSGHDLPAAFVSAYFQGMARGMIEAGQPVTRVLETFNRFLLEEWGQPSAATGRARLLSLCTCAVAVDVTRRELVLHNYGMPQPLRISSLGRLTDDQPPCAGPLGWFEALPGTAHAADLPEAGDYFVWTDGLADLASAHGVSSCSLATALLRSHLRGQTLPELADARDDVLVVRIHLAPASAGAESWLPILHETYAGDQAPQIDRLQQHWERSLQLALPDLSESRRFDILLATREAVINALAHGCQGLATRQAHLHAVARPHTHTLRLTISDSGPGHAYDWESPHRSDDLVDLHRGLALIHRLATKITSARQGAELTLDFNY